MTSASTEAPPKATHSWGAEHASQVMREMPIVVAARYQCVATDTCATAGVVVDAATRATTPMTAASWGCRKRAIEYLPVRMPF